MLRDLDQTIENLLYDEGNIPRGDIDIAFDSPTGEWSASLNRPTLNLWCFDMRENVQRRVAGMEKRIDRGQNQGRHQMPPRRIDLSYLVTAWARKVEDEHMLIWRALQTLKRFPLFRPEDCQGDLRYQKQNMPVLVAEPHDMGINMTDLWSVMENQMKLGFVTVVTVELDPEIGFDSPLVLEAAITVGQSERPLRRTLTVPDVVIRHPQEKTESTESEEGKS